MAVISPSVRSSSDTPFYPAPTSSVQVAHILVRPVPSIARQAPVACLSK